MKTFEIKARVSPKFKQRVINECSKWGLSESELLRLAVLMFLSKGKEEKKQ